MYIFISLSSSVSKSDKNAVSILIIYIGKYNESHGSTKQEQIRIQDTPKTPNYIPPTLRPFFFRKSIFFRNETFIKISVVCLLVWPAFGGPKFLAYIFIYIYIYIYREREMYLYTYIYESWLGAVLTQMYLIMYCFFFKPI